MPDNDTTKPPWWMDSIKTLGLPTVFLCLLLYMIWNAGVWAGNEVVMPLFEKQIQFIDKASEMTQEMNAATNTINKTLEAHGQNSMETLRINTEVLKTVSENKTSLLNIDRGQEEVVDLLKNIDENTKSLKTNTQ